MLGEELPGIVGAEGEAHEVVVAVALEAELQGLLVEQEAVYLLHLSLLDGLVGGIVEPADVGAVGLHDAVHGERVLVVQAVVVVEGCPARAAGVYANHVAHAAVAVDDVLGLEGAVDGVGEVEVGGNPRGVFLAGILVDILSEHLVAQSALQYGEGHAWLSGQVEGLGQSEVERHAALYVDVAREVLVDVL